MIKKNKRIAEFCHHKHIKVAQSYFNTIIWANKYLQKQLIDYWQNIRMKIVLGYQPMDRFHYLPFLDVFFKKGLAKYVA